jgi:hypothetical protein
VRDPREPATTDGYQRPQQPWQCGLADEGPACPMGPDAGGHCPAMAACRPVRDGERWHCNRSPLRGGPCSEGPGHDGACAIVYRCTPVRALRSRRGRFVIGVAVAALGAACMALSGTWRNDFLAPGPLSRHHAQLLEGQNATMRCAQCHAAGAAKVGEWWRQTIGTGERGVTQSTLCMTCHKNTIDREFALVAHSVGVEELQRAGTGRVNPPARLEDRLRDPREPIACSACHVEHQGVNHNLTAMSNDACQACHSDRFDSFADGHPEFAEWPYQRRTRIAFDHASHQLKHYPAEKRDFACAACHQADATGDRQLTASYATSCAECHDKALTASLAQGVPLLSLPMLDAEALAAAGQDVAPWPADATGDFEGKPAMPATLLLAGDPQFAEVMEALGSHLDLYDVDPDDRKQLAAAAGVARAVRSLADELANRGQTAIGDRLREVLRREVTAAELEALAAGLSPDVARLYWEQWFAKTPADESIDRATELAKAAGGGWVRDAATLSLRYRPTGHADPWLRAWLDVLAEAASGPQGARFEPLLRAALKPTTSGQCGSCHSVERNAAGQFAIQWRPFNPDEEPSRFTRFNHAPHVMQPQTGDCTSCHRVDVNVQTAANYVGDDPHRFVSGFAPMTKASCVACHTANAAGDNCTQCHNYHGERVPASTPSPALPSRGREPDGARAF